MAILSITIDILGANSTTAVASGTHRSIELTIPKTHVVTAGENVAVTIAYDSADMNELFCWRLEGIRIEQHSKDLIKIQP
jgi:hypothetical protein